MARTQSRIILHQVIRKYPLLLIGFGMIATGAGDQKTASGEQSRAQALPRRSRYRPSWTAQRQNPPPFRLSGLPPATNEHPLVSFFLPFSFMSLTLADCPEWDANSGAMRSPDLASAQASVKAASTKAGAYISMWSAWAAEKRSNWSRPATTTPSRAPSPKPDEGADTPAAPASALSPALPDVPDVPAGPRSPEKESCTEAECENQLAEKRVPHLSPPMSLAEPVSTT